MKHKYYTSAHQHLYQTLNLINNDRTSFIVEKERDYLLNMFKKIRQDYYELSKHDNIDCLFSDIVLQNKKIILVFEHIIIKKDSVFILERRKNYGNQLSLLKKKANFLKKKLGMKINVEYFIIADDNYKGRKKRLLSLSEFKKIAGRESGLNTEKSLADLSSSFINGNHIQLEITDYIKYKYRFNIDTVKRQRRSQIVEIMASFSRIKISALASLVFFIFTLNCMLSYYKITKTNTFYAALFFDVFFCIALDLTLSSLEKNYPKVIKYPVLLAFLAAMLYIFGKNLYYI